MRVFLHSRSAGMMNWLNEPHDFAQIPRVGDFVVKADGGPWFLVELVVHTPFECHFDAEVYAVQVDHIEAQKKAFVG